ncbi:hypothetical protein RDI58_000054 [Solanum bulbocastanum]|uniref:Uncharacterized protein n=1 Tax=Solanum bulbocastanum TaxID=147425 RepID=A0AAN8YNQ3_SOLBU
MLLWKEKKG